MSDEMYEIPDAPESFGAPPEKKSNKTLWIILAVVAVVLLCCCCIVVIGLIVGLSTGGGYDSLYYDLPLLMGVV
jgi:uncharacterized membrane protein